MTRNRGTLQAGRNTIVACRCCGARTRSSIEGFLDIRLCAVCLEHSSCENTHLDCCPSTVPFEQCDGECGGREICKVHDKKHVKAGAPLDWAHAGAEGSAR
jgi:hypothetical protein